MENTNTPVRTPEHLDLINDMGKIQTLVEAALTLTGNRDERLVQIQIIGVISDITEQWVGK